MSQTKHRDTAGQTESNQITLSHAEPSKNTQKHPHTGTEGSNPSLSATANSEKTGQAGQKLVSTTTREGLGTFALPLTKADCPDGLKCQKLVQQGFMRDHGPQSLAGGMHCYSVTQSGFDAVKRHSTPGPQISRGKARWRAFKSLREVCPGITFPEFLKSDLRERLELEALAHS